MKKEAGTGFFGIIILIVLLIVSKTVRYLLGVVLAIVLTILIIQIVKKKRAKNKIEEPKQVEVKAPDVTNKNYSQSKSTDRSKKGKSLISFPVDFTVIDIETTGFLPQNDKIIEISALKIKGMKIANEFSTLINPEKKLSKTIISITGITDDMLSSAPIIDDVIPKFNEFIGDDIIIGHNVSFDINFLFGEFERILNKPLSNDFVDTLRISRKILPDLEHHKLSDVAEALNVQQKDAHRGLADCRTTFDCYAELSKRISENGIDDFIKSFNQSHKTTHQKFTPRFDVRTVTAETENFDETHPLFNKRCVFTGELKKMPRSEATQIVVNFGGICENGVTLKTDFLILGDSDKDTKSGKQKKAEDYIQRGINIQIIAEDEFYEIIGNKSIV